jgi:hypothetical protein
MIITSRQIFISMYYSSNSRKAFKLKSRVGLHNELKLQCVTQVIEILSQRALVLRLRFKSSLNVEENRNIPQKTGV